MYGLNKKNIMKKIIIACLMAISSLCVVACKQPYKEVKTSQQPLGIGFSSMISYSYGENRYDETTGTCVSQGWSSGYNMN